MRQERPDYQSRIVIRRTAITILFVTATVKVVSLMGPEAALHGEEPIIGLEIRHVLALGAIAEYGLIAAVLTMTTARAKLLLAAVSAQFVAYHIAFAVLGGGRFCPCFGFVGQYLGLRPGTVDAISMVTAICLLGLSILPWKERPRNEDHSDQNRTSGMAGVRSSSSTELGI